MSKFRVGDIVAVTPDAVLRSGEIGRIDEARDEESFLPYKVRFAGGDVGWFDASELTPENSLGLERDTAKENRNDQHIEAIGSR